MDADPKKIVVTENVCGACGTEGMLVFHQAFPELQISGRSAEQAAERLSDRLAATLDAAVDPSHREPVRLAIADIRAFLNREEAIHPAREL